MNYKNTKCTPCNQKSKSLDIKYIKDKLKSLNNWQLNQDNKKIKKEFLFTNYDNTLEFVNKVAKIAIEQDHHPDIYFTYGKAIIEIYTHKINNLHENDFILARKIDISC